MTPRWQPTPDQIEASQLTAFMRAHGHADYESLRAWSVRDLPAFWTAVWQWYDVQADGSPVPVLASEAMPGATWFPDVALSYAEHVFRGKHDDDVALHHASELRPLETWTWGRLRSETARIRAGLRRLGVGHGDRVAAYLPNIPEALAAMLATASLGAVWSSCSPDFGPSTVLDRFEQIEPSVLLAVDGYRYGGKDFDRRAVVAELSAGLPTVTRTVTLGYLDAGSGDWDEVFGGLDTRSALLDQREEPLEFARVPFDHPLWVLYSSGTSGKPKAIVHGHGGILLEHLKVAGLHVDATAGDRVFWFTTTGWMMWNFLVSMLLTPAEIVLYDGLPSDNLWQLAQDAGITVFGTSAAFIHAQMKAGVTPPPLPRLRAVGSTGSPLSAAGFDWVWDHLGERTWLFSISGGTDVCSAFVGGVPTLPVRVGEIQARSLGCAVEAWDESGRPVVGEVGELVITRPMPSMPVGFWNDPGGTRYREAYFDFFPGVWRHGDWLEITPEGGCIIHGRSDATINRGGIRMGTAEIYAAVLAVDGVSDALVVDVPAPDPAGDSWMPLFVVSEAELTDDLVAQIRARVRTDCSPRHVPDVVVRVPAIPRTLTGKALEIPVKRLFLGADPESVAAKDALASPEAFDFFVEYVARHPAPGRGM